MRVFIVHAHPEQRSFNGAMTRSASEALPPPVSSAPGNWSGTGNACPRLPPHPIDYPDTSPTTMNDLSSKRAAIERMDDPRMFWLDFDRLRRSRTSCDW